MTSSEAVASAAEQKTFLVFYAEECSAYVRLAFAQTRDLAIAKLVNILEHPYGPEYHSAVTPEEISVFVANLLTHGAVFFITNCNKGTGTLYGFEEVVSQEDFEIRRDAYERWVFEAVKVQTCCQ